MWATGRESFGDFTGAAGGYAPGGSGGGGGGGGFVANAGQPDSGPSSDKKNRARNVAPATIRQIMESKGECFMVEDWEITNVIVIGLVKHVDVTSTRISYILDDQTGVIEAVQHIGVEDGVVDTATILSEGTYGRAVGMLRTNAKGPPGANKYIVLLKISPLTNMNELTVHMLEVLHLGNKLRQLKASQDAKITGAGMNNTIASAVFGTSFGAGDMTLGRIDLGGGGSGGNANDDMGASNGFTANQNLILNILRSCRGESGLHRNQIIQNVKSKMTAKEVESVLEYLSGEGHIFSTVDDDHYKVTDW